MLFHKADKNLKNRGDTFCNRTKKLSVPSRCSRAENIALQNVCVIPVEFPVRFLYYLPDN